MTDPPRGTVTFLFTDIENSTRLWQDHAGPMKDAYVRHDAIIRNAVRLHGGVIYKTVGDAFQIAFQTAPDAVLAACRAQQRLQGEAWPLPEPLNVRMALHSGAADPDAAGDYRSPLLNRLGRLMDAGHGGQVLLSRATRELVQDVLPSGVSLHDLGEQRLKDLDRPERVYQLVGPGLRVAFPVLRTLDRAPNNLPVQSTRFIGRGDDVAALHALLREPDVRLITLTGPGGMGKTRLALQVAAGCLDTFSDGVFIVDLASITDPELVPRAVARVVGAQERPGMPIEDVVREALAPRKLLLMLDNLEQVIESAGFVADVLGSCPGVKVLATSRIRLHLRGEQEYPVRPLESPDPAGFGAVASVTGCESVRLFVDRAQAARPGFRLSDENTSAIAEIVSRLDGLPLAIELAAARIRMLPPEAMLRRLESRLPLLTGGPRDLPRRQQTMHEAIRWSYELLTPQEQALFRRLSVFAGGWMLEGAEAVCGDDAPWNVFEGLERLVDHSLVGQVETGSELRFRMLETVREFGIDRLQDSGEAVDTRRRHARYIASLVELPNHEPPADELARWLDLVEREHDNVRSACEWALVADTPLAVRMIGHVGKFCVIRGHVAEGLSLLERALQGDMANVAIRDRGRCLHLAANLATLKGDFSSGRARYQEALGLYEKLGDKRLVVLILSHLASCADREGDYDVAMRLCDEAIGLARVMNDLDLLSYSLNVAGYMAYVHKDLQPARVYLDEAIDIAREREDMYLPFLLHSYADLCRAEGDLAQAESLYRESLSLAMCAKLGLSISSGLIGLATLRAMTGQADRAAMLLGAEESFRRDKGFDVDHDLAEDYGQVLAQVESELGTDAFARVWAEGATTPIEDVIVRALDPSSEPGQLDVEPQGARR